MVSYGPDTQSLNYTHMWDFQDLCTENVYCTTKGSIMNWIVTNPKCRKFSEIIRRARMYEQLDNMQADFTVLVPMDDAIPDGFITYMDDGQARQIINASIMNRKIDKKLLTSSPVAYYFTMNPKMRLYITNISGHTRVNNCLEITQFDIPANNGLIHITNGLVVPSEDHFLN